MKNTPEEINSMLNEAQDQVSELEDKITVAQAEHLKKEDEENEMKNV